MEQPPEKIKESSDPQIMTPTWPKFSISPQKIYIENKTRFDAAQLLLPFN